MVCERRGLKRDAARYWDVARNLEDAGVRAPSAVDLAPPLSEDPAKPAAAELGVVPGEAPTTDPPIVHRSSPTLPLGGLDSTDGEAADGTANVSVEELAVLHWNGAVPSSIARSIVHQWQPEEETALRRAAAVAMSPDVTSLMTEAELAEIHGRSPLTPAQEADAEATAILEQTAAIARVKASDPEADGTAWISSQKLAEIRARMGAPTYEASVAPVDSEPTEQRPRPPAPPVPAATKDVGDETTVMTREHALELARRYTARRSRGDGTD